MDSANFLQPEKVDQYWYLSMDQIFTSPLKFSKFNADTQVARPRLKKKENYKYF
jgi:hypothetical protein